MYCNKSGIAKFFALFILLTSTTCWGADSFMGAVRSGATAILPTAITPSGCLEYQDVGVPLVNGTTLNYRIWQGGIEDTCAGQTGKIDLPNCNVIFDLYPNHEKSLVNYSMIKGAVKDENGNPLEAIWDGRKWFLPSPLVYITGKPAAVSVIGNQIQSPLLSNR